MAITVGAILVAALLVSATVAKPVSEDCVVDETVFQKDFDAQKFCGKWFIDQHDTEEHVGKWRANRLTIEGSKVHFTYGDGSEVVGTIEHEEGMPSGDFRYSDDGHSSEVRIVSTDYNTALVYEVLVSQAEEDHVGALGDSQVYLLSRAPELNEEVREMLYEKAHKLSVPLCLHHGEVKKVNVEEETTEGSGAEQSGEEHSGDVSSGEASSGDVGSGDVSHVGSGEESGEASGETDGHEGSGESSGNGDEHVCPNVLCAMFCEYGYKTDENGCNNCECVEETCSLLREAVESNIKKGLETGNPLLGAEKPVCEEDGTYSAKQCSGSKCYCVSPDGAVIDIFLDVDRWEAAHLTCGCAREHFTQSSLGKEAPSVLCDPIGNYQPVQCNDAMCYCVDPSTGAPVEGSQLPLSERESLLKTCSAGKDVVEIPEIPEKTDVIEPPEVPEEGAQEVPEIVEKVGAAVEEPPK